VVESKRPGGRSSFFFICSLFCCAILCWAGVSCSSSSSGSKQTEPGGLAFLQPTTSPTLDPGESITLYVNQSATFTLQSGCGTTKPEGTFNGGVLTATGTTVVYTAPATPGICLDDVVVATASNTSVQLPVFYAASFPAVSFSSNETYSGAGCSNSKPCCPASGTVILAGSQRSVLQVGTYAATVGPITASGGVPPYTWTVASGSQLPDGLELNPQGTQSSELYISGTPVAPGCTAITVELQDSTAAANCTPGTSSPCTTATLNVVVIPTALQVQIPDYPSALNDQQNNGQGAPYPPITLGVSGGQQPYSWCQNSADGLTLPPGLQINSIAQAGFSCPTVVSSAQYATLSGTPIKNSDDSTNTYCSNTGCYTTQFYVNDSQTPYPATKVVNVSMQDLPLIPCSQENQALPLAGAINPDAYLQGTIAFMMRGFDANGPAVIAGSVTMDGQGDVTGGTLDVTRSTGHQQFAVQSSGSSYVVGTTVYLEGQFGSVPPSGYDYSRGCMTLALTNVSTGVSAPSTTFAFTLGGCSNGYNVNGVISTSNVACGYNTNNQPSGNFTTGHIIEFDDNTGSGTRASGILRVQTSSAFAGGLSGPYAFGMSGGDASQKHFAMAGSFQASSGSISAAAADSVDGAACGSSSSPCNTTFTSGSGSYTADPTYGSSNGRWTGTLSLNSQTNYDLAIYVVSANEALVASTDQLSSSQPIVGGEAITTATTFSNASLEEPQIFHIGGLAGAGPDVSVGILTFDGIGSVGGTVYEDQAGTLFTTAISGVYGVSATNGRTVFTAPVQGQTLGGHSFIAYIVPPSASLNRADCSTPAACVTGFLVGTDNTAQSGVMEFQIPVNGPPPPFQNLFVDGNYAFGTDETLDALTPNIDGDVDASPSASSTTSGSLGVSTSTTYTPFIQDASYGDSSYYCVTSVLCYLLQPNQVLAGSYSVGANGSGTFGGNVVSVTNGNVVFYIDESPTNLHPSVMVVEQ
jgi:hypothetical protein